MAFIAGSMTQLEDGEEVALQIVLRAHYDHNAIASCKDYWYDQDDTLTSNVAENKLTLSEYRSVQTLPKNNHKKENKMLKSKIDVKSALGVLFLSFILSLQSVGFVYAMPAVDDIDGDTIINGLDSDIDGDGILNNIECTYTGADGIWGADSTSLAWTGPTTSTVSFSSSAGAVVSSSVVTNRPVSTPDGFDILPPATSVSWVAYNQFTAGTVVSASFSPAVPASEIALQLMDWTIGTEPSEATLTLTGAASLDDFEYTVYSGFANKQSYNKSTGVISKTNIADDTTSETGALAGISDSLVSSMTITTTTPTTNSDGVIVSLSSITRTCLDANSDGVNDVDDGIDTDGDGVSNGIELLGTTAVPTTSDPSDPCSGTVHTGWTDQTTNDCDTDGLTSAQEAAAGTDANNNDTDGDGVLDGAESPVSAALDPCDPVSCDTDNITDTVEDAAPNSGDANGDGTMDSEQANVTSAPNPNNSNAYVSLSTVTTSTTTCSDVTNLGFATEASLPTQDSTHDYPLGLFDFTVTCTTNGDTAYITYYLDKEYDTTDWVWRKFNPNTSTYVTMDNVAFSTATVGSVTVTTAVLAVTDGSDNDDDITANGTIIDPSGPSIPASLADTGTNPATLIAAGTAVVALAFTVRGKTRKLYSAIR